MPYPAVAVANEFLRIAEQNKVPLTPMKLQKLVYFAHGWYLALTGRPLIEDYIQAWQYGPVIPSLYREFRRFGTEPITALALADQWTSENNLSLKPYSIDDCPDAEENAAAKQIIRRVWESYGKLSAVQLSNLTHEADSPWSLTPDKEYRGTIIPQERIREYFERLAQANRRTA